METGKKHSPIIDALDAAMAKTSVDIHVLLTRKFFDFNPLRRCRSWYSKLKIGSQSPQGGILIYVNTRSRKVAIYGGPEIHSKVGQPYWNQAIRLLQSELHSTHYENAISTTIETLVKNLEHNLQR